MFVPGFLCAARQVVFCGLFRGVRVLLRRAAFVLSLWLREPADRFATVSVPSAACPRLCDAGFCCGGRWPTVCALLRLPRSATCLVRSLSSSLLVGLFSCCIRGFRREGYAACSRLSQCCLTLWWCALPGRPLREAAGGGTAGLSSEYGVCPISRHAWKLAPPLLRDVLLRRPHCWSAPGAAFVRRTLRVCADTSLQYTADHLLCLFLARAGSDGVYPRTAAVAAMMPGQTRMRRRPVRVVTCLLLYLLSLLPACRAMLVIVQSERHRQL